jgi:ATP-dependent Lon protease
MIPFVERNYNLVELGPRGTGKSHLFQQISPYAHLISGGKATVAKMFVNNASGQRGLVCQYDVVCFDEVSGISFDQKDGVNIMKGYMASGQFSRGKENIRADGSIVMVGNFDVDVEQQQRSATCSARCRPRCATTRRSWTASTRSCPAGTSRS